MGLVLSALGSSMDQKGDLWWCYPQRNMGGLSAEHSLSNTIWNSHLPLFQYLPPSSYRAPTLVFWVLLGKIGIISFCDAILHWVFILLIVTYFCLYISPQIGFLLSNWGIWVVTHYFLFPLWKRLPKLDKSAPFSAPSRKGQCWDCFTASVLTKYTFFFS